jgi:acetamidase/formamidase
VIADIIYASPLRPGRRDLGADCGPIVVRNAKPGDVVAVWILDHDKGKPSFAIVAEVQGG